MSNDAKFTVARMPHAYVTPDGEKVELEYEDETGRKFRLSFSGDLFERYSALAIQLFTHARNQKHATSGHREIQPVPAIATMANAATGGGRVILSTRADNGVPYHFSISPEEAEELARQLLPAAKAARRQASQPRH